MVLNSPALIENCMLSLANAVPTSKLKYSDTFDEKIPSGLLVVPANQSLSSWNVTADGNPRTEEKTCSSQSVEAVVADNVLRIVPVTTVMIFLSCFQTHLYAGS